MSIRLSQTCESSVLAALPSDVTTGGSRRINSLSCGFGKPGFRLAILMGSS